MLHQSIPILPSMNLRATVDFYVNRLGFKGINLGRHAIVTSGKAELRFELISNPLDFHAVSCLLFCDNVEDLYTSLAGMDMMEPEGQIQYVKSGHREFTIKDNFGNIIRFGKYAAR